MSDNSDVEVELYEEVVGRVSYSTPHISPDPVRSQSLSDEPMEQLTGRTDAAVSTTFTPILRPALRDELATVAEEPWTIGVTLAPERGARLAELQKSDGDGLMRNEKCVHVDRSAFAAPVSVHETDRVSVESSDDDRPRSAAAKWMPAITARLDSLWNVVHGRSRIEPETVLPQSRSSDCEIVTRQPLSVRYVPSKYYGLDSTVEIDQNMFRNGLQDTEASDFCTDIQQEIAPKRRIWHLDSDTEIDLDAPAPTEPDLELCVDPRKSHGIRPLSLQQSHGLHNPQAVPDEVSKSRVVTVTRQMQPRVVQIADTEGMAPRRDSVNFDQQHGKETYKSGKQSTSSQMTIQERAGMEASSRHER